MKYQNYKSVCQNIKGFLISDRFPFILMAVGILLRLKHYMENRPFTLDETYVAIKIVNRSWMEIVRFKTILPEQPKLPLLFALIEKLFVSIGGNNEYALRLFPLLCGISSIFLFYSLSKKCLDRGAVPVALGLFVLSGGLIYYSAELKPYVTDVLITLFLYGLYEHYRGNDKNFVRFGVLGIIGGFAMWFSHASIFILAVIGLVLTVKIFLRRQKEYLGLPAISLVFWLMSFLILYKISFREMLTGKEILSSWNGLGAFMPRPVGFLEGFFWIKDAFLRVFQNPAGISFPLLACGVFILGSISFFKKDKERFFIYVFPFLMTLSAGIMRKYPFHGRVLLFLIPSLLIFVAEGSLALICKFKKYSNVAGLIILGLLFQQPLVTAGYYLIHNRSYADSRAVMQYLKRNYQSSDALYFNGNAFFPFCYYLSRINLIERIPEKEVIFWDDEFMNGFKVGIFKKGLEGEGTRRCALFRYEMMVFNQRGLFRASLINHELRKPKRLYKDMPCDFEDKRVWIFLAHDTTADGEFILALFDKQGKRLKGFRSQGASIYLYDLSKEP